MSSFNSNLDSNLSSMGLNGTLPESLGSLESLQVLNLAWNELEGPIPESFASLTKLKRLLLNMNNLNGTIPLQLGGRSQLQLERVNLAANSFEGDPPEYIGLCKSTFGSFDMSALGVDGKWIWEIL